ncbi:unnamed protein product [Dibothriocephalus latus]|uniref:C2H2-type domain-containing protein n=1 Tax=Dibothriocephalus latus TaxID=60516 RepID=A0A3P7MIZ9_DIBLA|nr:unnamed protein product [Dibothriocephalus latus]
MATTISGITSDLQSADTFINTSGGDPILTCLYCHRPFASLIDLVVHWHILHACSGGGRSEDLERNDGSAEKPYYMSTSMMKALGKAPTGDH